MSWKNSTIFSNHCLYQLINNSTLTIFFSQNPHFSTIIFRKCWFLKDISRLLWLNISMPSILQITKYILTILNSPTNRVKWIQIKSNRFFAPWKRSPVPKIPDASFRDVSQNCRGNRGSYRSNCRVYRRIAQREYRVPRGSPSELIGFRSIQELVKVSPRTKGDWFTRDEIYNGIARSEFCQTEWIAKQGGRGRGYDTA